LNEHANKLINKLKINKYKEIFNKLVGDNDGLISYDNLKVIDINNEELLQISSLIDEIKTNKLTTLSFIDFKKLAEKFYNQ
jgi:Ca2+-binding EF-hand superfamily protein